MVSLGACPGVYSIFVGRWICSICYQIITIVSKIRRYTSYHTPAPLPRESADLQSYPQTSLHRHEATSGVCTFPFALEDFENRGSFAFKRYRNHAPDAHLKGRN